MGFDPVQWIDAAWLPLVFFVVHKHQRMIAIGFVLSCMIMMRLLIELIISAGYPNGIMPILDYHVSTRGMVVYGVAYVIYMIGAHYSTDTRGAIFLAASISILFAASFVFAVIMVL